MSDQSQGPGWWLASDGKWYPPDQAPAVPPPETWSTPPVGPPPSPGMPTSAKVAIGVVVGLVALVILGSVAVYFLSSESESSFSSVGSTIGDGGAGGDRGDGGDGGSSDAGPVDVPEGFEVIEGDGVSIAVPDDWQEIDPSDFAMSADEFAEAFPDAPEGMLEQGTAFFEQGAVLVAFELNLEFASNVNIIDVPGEAPLGIVESQADSQLSSLGADVESTERVDLPVGEAVRVQYTLPVALPDGGTIPAEGVQLYVPLDGRTYIITISTSDDAGALADQMAETFRAE